MESNRQIRRAQKQQARIHNDKLESLLQHFFRFLDRKPQPSDEQVRIEFCKSELKWKQYCTQNRLGTRTSMLFNAKVAYEWERKYVRKNKPTESETPK